MRVIAGPSPLPSDSDGRATPITCRTDTGPSLAAVWDGARGVFEMAGTGELIPIERECARLALTIEAANPPLVSMRLVREDALDTIAAPSERQIGTVPVRFDPADAEILAAFVDGVVAPLPAHELNRWATTIALTPGFVRDFVGEARVLISTEAGGEGRNLQFAHGLVNYDLPWNPMRIEQRIGRLSRVGQTHDVHVFNLVAPGTIEETLLEVLDAKINMFELVIIGLLDGQRLSLGVMSR